MCLQPAPEGAECLWRCDAGWQTVPDARSSDEEGHQSSNDAMTALREQTLTQNAAVFLRRCPPHDTARSPGTMQRAEHEHSEFKLISLAHRQPMKVVE